ncbi:MULTISPECIES: FecR family protein [Brevundimonas]|uniref:Putative anti-sigma factor n=1 Tax=Brevundimonas abyssalis TAR-001 TaxID=1391729 RepID=A0A8E0NAM7_9CAUL|nr:MULTISPECIES: FecR domain-containing protein [Brevundimonas]GAD58273.1 putative anti-sigma factor [Brevundimonas abyssalis TAR-001]
MSRAAEIEKRATLYLMRRDEPDWSPDDQAALDGWLSESMAHRAAFLRLQHVWDRADRIAALGDQSTRAKLRRGPGTSLKIIALAATLCGLAYLGVFLIRSSDITDRFLQRFEMLAQSEYETPVGGQRTVAMADGSTAELNTATRLRTAVGEDRREVWLDYGEAFFEVTPDPSVPFVVHAGDRTITVLGTSFSVRVDGEEVSVSVLEGRVRLDAAELPAGPSPRSAPTLSGGELAVARGAETLIATDAVDRVDRALAWRHGMVSFQQATLAEVAEEFNRYNTRQIVVDDPAVAAMRIGGNFRPTNSDAFLRLLQRAYGLQVMIEDERVIISQ